jgi:hypothetical protein
VIVRQEAMERSVHRIGRADSNAHAFAQEASG